jgi:hypothetical protein
MPTVVLRDHEGRDQGFLLIAGHAAVFAADTRDVVFMALPSPAASSIATFLQEFRHVEFKAHMTGADAGRRIAFAVAPDLSFLASLDATGMGSWSVGTVAGGTCRLLDGS